MTTDPFDARAALLDVARAWRATPDDLYQLAAELRHGADTLREALDKIESKTKRPVADRYRQGRARLLEGHLPGDWLVKLTPYGDLPYTALEPLSVQADLDRLVEASGAQEVARARARGHPFADANPKCHGSGSGRQYLWAAKEVDRQLCRAGYLRAPKLGELPEPRRPGPSRSKNLTEQELLDYVNTVLWTSPDPRLDALLWLCYRITLARGSELRHADLASVNRARPSLSVGGKGGRVRELPVHSRLLDAVVDLATGRPVPADTDQEEPLFRTRNGHRIRVRQVERWSAVLHDRWAWAQGHEIRVHTLRHTGSAAINTAAGPVADGLVLGHSRAQIFSTTGIYLPDEDPFPQRCAAVEAAFGPLDGWPDLPETDLIYRLTGLGPGSDPR
ncbi:site-specific recombinase XerC [Geodermatophilus bullaregiensis]|uniref:site-specific integrase n=1 Tax=Geodermatophilus bullaregiensis TaxID=1564160 RepID=UPI00195D742D|nr:tyrosine-type recombinase/integrase [Geodermatophilus bullaregiensis]MBM7804180.1 site-specific recombinase XerC [Geodermatophilus bullaregiensis]